MADNEQYDVLEPVVGFRSWKLDKIEGRWLLTSLIMHTKINRFLLNLLMRLSITGKGKKRKEYLKILRDTNNIDALGIWPAKEHDARCIRNELQKEAKKLEALTGQIGVSLKSKYIMGVDQHRPAGSGDCECGVYLWNDLITTSTTGEICGAVKAWGKIQIHTKSKGIRVEHAEILALALTPFNSLTPFRSLRARRVIKRLCAEYGVPQVKIQELPEIAKQHGQPMWEIKTLISSPATAGMPTRVRFIRRIFWSAWVVEIFGHDLLGLIQGTLYFFLNDLLLVLLLLLVATWSKRFRKWTRLDK